MVALKFSTILTENSYKNLEDIIFNQYYDIELYIKNLSNIIQLSKTDLLDKISNSSFFLASVYNKIDKKIIGFYTVLNEIIQKRLKNINKEEYNNYRKLDNSIINFKDEIEESNKVIEEQMILIEDDYDPYDDYYNDDANNDDDEVIYENEDDDDDDDNDDNVDNDHNAHNNHKEHNDDNDDNDDDGLVITLFKKEKGLTLFPKFEFSIPIIPILNFEIIINPSFNLKVGVALTLEKKDDFSLNIDVWGEVEVKIVLEAALSFPKVESNLKKIGVPVISVAVGMEGKLISIRVGLKLSLSFKVITPAAARTLRARPSLVKSFGTAIVSPSFNSSMDLILLEYTFSGIMKVFPIA
jgi:hypothetical protein